MNNNKCTIVTYHLQTVDGDANMNNSRERKRIYH
jgi:hypothetical protein